MAAALHLLHCYLLPSSDVCRQKCFMPICKGANLNMLQGVRGLGGVQDELISGGEDTGTVLPNASP